MPVVTKRCTSSTKAQVALGFLKVISNSFAKNVEIPIKIAILIDAYRALKIPSGLEHSAHSLKETVSIISSFCTRAAHPPGILSQFPEKSGQAVFG